MILNINILSFCIFFNVFYKNYTFFLLYKIQVLISFAIFSLLKNLLINIFFDVF